MTKAIQTFCERESNSRLENTRRPKSVHVLFYWRVTHAFCCCIYPAVKATGVCIVLYNMNNSKHNACANTTFRAFSCEGICSLPGCEKQVLLKIGKASISLHTRAFTLVHSPFLQCLKHLRCLARDRKCKIKSNRPLQGPLRGCKTNWFFD